LITVLFYNLLFVCIAFISLVMINSGQRLYDLLNTGIESLNGVSKEERLNALKVVKNLLSDVKTTLPGATTPMLLMAYCPFLHTKLAYGSICYVIAQMLQLQHLRKLLPNMKDKKRSVSIHRLEITSKGTSSSLENSEKGGSSQIELASSNLLRQDTPKQLTETPDLETDVFPPYWNPHVTKTPSASEHRTIPAPSFGGSNHNTQNTEQFLTSSVSLSRSSDDAESASPLSSSRVPKSLLLTLQEDIENPVVT